MTQAEILARLEELARVVIALRDQVAAEMPPVEDSGLDPSADDDFAPEHLIEISTAVERFNRPADSLRWLCRKQGCGVKVGGRWLASGPRLARYLNGSG